MNLISILISVLLLLFWFFIILFFCWLLFQSWQRSNEKTQNYSLINKIFVSKAKFYFLRNKFTDVVFDINLPFLKDQKISLEFFLSLFSINDQKKINTFLSNYTNKPFNYKIAKNFTADLKIFNFEQKIYFQMVGCFSKKIQKEKMYKQNFVLLVLSNLDKIIR